MQLNSGPPDRSATARRIAVVENDADMAALFEDLLAEQGTVTHVREITSLTTLAEASPDVVVLGLDSYGGLPAWQLIELIRQHRVLHTVPIVVTLLNVAAAMRDGRLATYRGVHAVEMPCEIELLQSVIGRVQPCSEAADASAIALRDVSTGRLPDVCPHGYAPASRESCRICRAAGSEFAMASLADRAPYADR